VPETAPRPPRGTWLPAAAALLAFVVFLPALQGGFVYDDHRFYETNTALAQPSVLWRAFSDPAVQTADDTYAGLWRPLRTLLFAAEQFLFGARAWGAHLVSLGLHAAGTALFALLLRKWGAGPFPALLGALLYALHPAQVECVAWVSSQGDLLSVALLFGALLLDAGGRWRNSAALGVLALLAKEQAVVWAPFVALSALLCGDTLRGALRRAALPTGLTLGFVVVRQLVLAEPFQEGGVLAGPAGVGELGGMLAHQAWFLGFPVGGVFDWQMQWPPATVLGGLALAAVATATLAKLAHRLSRLPVLWFLVALTPTLFVQAVIPLNIRTADRFLLFALPALGACAALAATRHRRLLAPVAVCVACFCAITLQTTPLWANETALWSATAERFPGHWRAETWLGTIYTETDPMKAVSHLERAVDVAPMDAATRFRMARALEARMRQESGEEQLATGRLARNAYLKAMHLTLEGRQENAAATFALAKLRAADLTLAMGEADVAVTVAEDLVSGPRPTLPAGSWALWNQWLEEFASRVEEYLDPGLTTPLAPRLREWGRLQ
jgi:hypothetical protein